MPKIAGNPGLVFRGNRIYRDSTGGKQMFAVYTGPRLSILGAAANLDKSNTPYNVDGIGPRWELEQRLTASPTELLVPTREERLHFNRIAKTLYDHPELADLTRETKLKIKKAADGDTSINLATEITDADALAIADLIVKQIDHFTVYQPVVRVSETSLFNHPWTIGFTNVGEVFTTAQMISDAGLISNWASNLPQDSPDPTGYHYGWVKQPPEILTAAGDRSQLVVEYEYGLWNALLYPPV